MSDSVTLGAAAIANAPAKINKRWRVLKTAKMSRPPAIFSGLDNTFAGRLPYIGKHNLI